jgi:Fe-Mn family superoxide dismutase
MLINLPDLPYSRDALQPVISAKTLEFHHGKHHNTYVANTNKLITGTEFESMDLVEIIRRTANDSSKSAIFNNAAQAWNHSFYWNCMKPGGGGKPIGAIAEKISNDFNDYNEFAEQLKTAAITQFGSGWAWLILKQGKLKITKTLNADTPIANGEKPLLTIDVWEHAYYLDYQNRRPDYVSLFIEKLINWDFINSQLS